MGGLFYKLGKLAGPKVRKAKWAWTAATASEAEMIEAERAVGRDMFRSICSRCKICTDTDTSKRLQEIGTKFAGHVKNKLRNFDFICIETARPEAFCLPGGYIFISHAMWILCGDNRNQLAFVLAHEMSHLLEGHVMERMAGNALITAAARNKAVRVVSGGLQKLGIEFLEKAYSRDQELRADRLGLYLMKVAGFDPAGAVELLSQLEPLEQKGLLSPYFSTHPNCRQRIAQLTIPL